MLRDLLLSIQSPFTLNVRTTLVAIAYSRRSPYNK